MHEHNKTPNIFTHSPVCSHLNDIPTMNSYANNGLLHNVPFHQKFLLKLSVFLNIVIVLDLRSKENDYGWIDIL